MISALKGIVVSLSPGSLDLETAGGVVYHLWTPIHLFSELKTGDSTALHTVLKIKDEDIQVYGFLEIKEKILFEKLLQVSGIGGRLALACISTLPARELAEAIEAGDADRIATVPGIGRKTAQRMVLELTGKVDLDKTGGADQRLRDELNSALFNLGFNPKSAREAVTAVMKDNPVLQEFEPLFKLVLKRMSR